MVGKNVDDRARMFEDEIRSPPDQTAEMTREKLTTHSIQKRLRHDSRTSSSIIRFGYNLYYFQGAAFANRRHRANERRAMADTIQEMSVKYNQTVFMKRKVSFPVMAPIIPKLTQGKPK